MIEHPFAGSALCKVDTAGRWALPVFVRHTLARRGDAGFLLVAAHAIDPCLTAYDRGLVPILHAEAERRRIAEEAVAPQAHYARGRLIFGFVEEVAIGNGGAVALPALMRRRAGLGGVVLIVAAGAAFDIWDPQRALARGDPDLRELAAWHLEVQQAA